MQAQGARRPWVAWGLSLLGAAAFLWLASTRLRLWPETFTLESPALLAAAAAMHVPYAAVRALRLQYVFDPVIARSGGTRISRRLLYGSGFLSFFVLLVLPLKLGELSRPMLLARGRQPGLGLPEAVGGVALERLVDGLIIIAMLFGGLALSEVQLETSLADVRAVGVSMSAVFGVGLLVLVAAARMPQRAATLASAVAGIFGSRARTLVGGLVERVAGTMRGVLALEHAGPFLAWSIVYWAITATQLWLVLEACGIHLNGAAAAAIIAIVGLSIQLPGGPAQFGTFQVGTGLALPLYLDAAALHSAGSTFSAVMYALQLVGAGLMALPGLALLARVPQAHDEEDPPPLAP